MSCAFTQEDELLRYSTDLAWEGARVQAIRNHVDHCQACKAELEGLIEVQEALIDCVQPEAPPKGLDAALRARLGPRPKEATEEGQRAGLAVVRKDDSAWQATRYDGISMKPLSHDLSNERMTLLLRMEPGAVYPPHHHEGAEECFMVEGTVISDGVRYQAGDYMRAEAHSDHGLQTTDTGCLMLLSRCTRDKVHSL